MPPGRSAVDVEAFPSELTSGKRFVSWRYEERDGERAKVPYSPNTGKRASATDPSTWATFELTRSYAEVAALEGVMRAFDPEDGLVGTDLDDSLDPTIEAPSVDDLDPWAAEIVRRTDTYTEVSPSGRGVKLWARGTLPGHGRKRGSIEMYQDKRFFTVTGRHLAGTPRTIAYRPDAILAIHRQVFGDAPDPAAITVDRDNPVPALELGDDEVLRLASDSPHNGERFRRLWTGDTSYYAVMGNDGESEADAALCELLAYYGGPDPERLDRLFRRSSLYREKWERTDYRERTIALALRDKTRFYGDGIQPPASGSDGAVGCACECCPHDDGPEVARLRRLALDRDDLVEAQSSIINAQRSELDREREYRAEDRRLRLAEQELRRVKAFSATQKDAIVATARIAASAASRGNEAPVITRLMVAEDIGCHEATAGAALKVFDLPGSPIERVAQYVERVDDDGRPLSKKIIQFKVETPCPADILETMVDLGRGLAERHRRYQARACPDHPDAGTDSRTIVTCAECDRVLDERTTAHPPAIAVREDEARCERVAPIGEPPPTVAVPVTSPERLARIGARGPIAANGHGHAPLDGNGAAALVIGPPPGDHQAPMRLQDQVDDLIARHTRTAPASSWRCMCGSDKRVQRQPWGDYVCDYCGVCATSPEDRP